VVDFMPPPASQGKMPSKVKLPSHARRIMTVHQIEDFLIHTAELTLLAILLYKLILKELGK
jgi:hypothetical protein